MEQELISLRQEQSENKLDAHIHLQKIDGFSLNSGMPENGISSLLCNSVEEADWETVTRISGAEAPDVIPFYGIHPWYGESADEGWAARLKAEASKGPSGIGETGLDWSRSVPDRKTQTALFETHIAIAEELHRPLSIHCVKSWNQVLSMLKGVKIPVMIHSFSGSMQLMEDFVSRGVFLSFSGYLISPKAEKLRRVFAETPADSILMESDFGPCFPGSTWNSYSYEEYMENLYREGAALHGIDINDFKRRISANGKVFADTATYRQ